MTDPGDPVGDDAVPPREAQVPAQVTTAAGPAAPTRARLAVAVRAAIGDGTFPPGSRLNERELCETYGVSRTVVRETLRQLEAEGFVVLEANRGAVVPEISYADAQALFEVRGALEALACSLFAQRGTVEQKRALTDALRVTEQVMRQRPIDEVLRVKDAFYDALLDGAGNSELTSTLRLLHARINLLRRHSLSAPGRTEHTLAEIGAICQAIVAGDVEGARIAGSHHVAQARFAALPRIFEEEYGRDR
jgi:DNA-binding GntR family transcriptional regulator